MSEALTPRELACLDSLTAAFRMFKDLPRCHPTEVEEVTTHVHAFQRIVMARAAVRAYPDRFVGFGEI